MAARDSPTERVSAWSAMSLPGREALVDELTALAASAAAGSGAVVLLTGEAGIGKTSVARAVARHVRDDLTVSWGNCTADRSAPPFWPWLSVVDVAVSAPAGPGEADPAIGVPRFEHLNEVRGRVLEEARPRLHVIEDVQWADVASVLLLAHVAASIVDRPLVVLATLRTGEPLARPLEDAIEDVRRSAVVREVPPLSDQAVEQLIREAGLDPEAAVGRRVRARGGGNPLFVAELLRAVAAPDVGGAPPGTGAEDVPTRIAGLIAHRLARLPDPVAALLVTASVVGTDGDTRTLATVRGVPVESVVDLLEQARAARLLDAAAPGRWQFRHALVRDAIYLGVTDAERARTHAALVDALVGAGGAPPAVLAHHALAALPLFDPDEAVALAARAGESALALHAYEEAVAWFERALAAATAGSGAWPRAELLVRSGEAHRHLGQIEQAQAAFLEAAGLTDDPDLLARAALGFADPGADLGIAYRSEDLTTAALLERAIDAQPSEATAVTVLLEARLASELYFSDQPGRARSLADQARERARRLDDRRALGAVHAVIHDAFVVGQAPLDDQLRGSQQLLDWAWETDGVAARLAAHRARVFDLLAAGDVAAVDTEILAFRRLAEPLRAPGYLWWPALWSAMRALLEGRHDVAEERAFAAFDLGERPFPALAFGNLSFLLFFLRREQGRLEELEQATRDYASSAADIPAIRVALIFLLAEIGRIDEARGMLAGLSSDELSRLRDRNWPASWFQLARATLLVGDRDLATRLLDDRIRPTERCVPVSLGTVCLGATDLAAAWLHHAVGDLDAADERYAAAEVVNAQLGARSWLAQTRADRAAALVDRDGAGDRDEGRRLVELAHAAADEIGLVTLTRELLALRARLDAAAADSSRPIASATGTFRRAGEVWEVTFAGTRAQLAPSRGLHDLAFLLARPGQAVSVLELQSEPGTVSDTSRGAAVLDERARREIRARLRELDEAIDAAEADHDGERASLAREQRQQLAEAVARDLGLAGRSRRIGDPVERARKTVSTRIRRTIVTIGRAHPELGRHLERSIDTGAWCAYRPAEPIDWIT